MKKLWNLSSLFQYTLIKNTLEQLEEDSDNFWIICSWIYCKIKQISEKIITGETCIYSTSRIVITMREKNVVKVGQLTFLLKEMFWSNLSVIIINVIAVDFEKKF